MCSLRFSSTDSTANFSSPVPVICHALVSVHPLAQTDEHMPDERIAMPRPAIMDPFAVAPRFHQAGPAEMSQVSRDFWLDHPQGIGQFANASVAAREQIEQAQPGRISQRLKQKCRLTVFPGWFHST